MKVYLKNVRLETGYVYEEDLVVATETVCTNVLIENGKFMGIGDDIVPQEARVIDAKGQLLVPSFKEMHTHIDKTYFGGEWQAPIPATDGIFSRFEEEAKLLPGQLHVAEERAHAMVGHYIDKGHTHIRTHVNVDPAIETKHIDIVKGVLASYEDIITYEIVAFPQHGLFRNGEQFLAIFEQALQMGVTHIGGVDPSIVDGDSEKVIQYLFDMAEKYNIGIDIHLHEANTLGAYAINQILDEVEQRAFTKEVTISHAFALADLPAATFDALVNRMAKHQVSVATTVPIGRGPITIPVKTLYDRGVNIYFGHDSLMDHWSPFGSGDTIQKLNQFVQRFGYIDELQLGQSLKYATGGISALSEKGEQLWPKVGDAANALLVDAVSTAHLIARRCPISTVLANGRVVRENEIELKGAFR